jgi:hypothetical protein
MLNPYELPSSRKFCADLLHPAPAFARQHPATGCCRSSVVSENLYLPSKSESQLVFITSSALFQPNIGSAISPTKTYIVSFFAAEYPAVAVYHGSIEYCASGFRWHPRALISRPSGSRQRQSAQNHGARWMLSGIEW